MVSSNLTRCALLKNHSRGDLLLRHCLSELARVQKQRSALSFRWRTPHAHRCEHQEQWGSDSRQCDGMHRLWSIALASMDGGPATPERYTRYEQLLHGVRRNIWAVWEGKLQQRQ